MDAHITETDLLAALEAALAGTREPDGALTTQELAALTGWSTKTVCKALRALAQAGRLMVVKTYRPAVDGVARYRPGYRLRR